MHKFIHTCMHTFLKNICIISAVMQLESQNKKKKQISNDTAIRPMEPANHEVSTALVHLLVKCCKVLNRTQKESTECFKLYALCNILD